VSAVSSIWCQREKKKAKGCEGAAEGSVETFLLMRRRRKRARFLGVLHTLLPKREIRDVGRVDDRRTTGTLAAGRDASTSQTVISA